MALDWHSPVYGSRTGRLGGNSRLGLADDDDQSFGDGVTYGQWQAVPDATLKKRGGSAYFRAYQVISSGRLHHVSVASMDDTLLLSASVDGVEGISSDYQVSARIDQSAGDITEASCTCPAFGRFGALCKHVIALVMHYNDSPEDFHQREGDGPREPVRRTSRQLQAFMLQEDADQQQRAKARQLELLKEVGSLADSGGAGVASQPNRRMGIATVGLRPSVECMAQGWQIRLHIIVAAHGINYVVKDVQELVRAVRWQQYAAYGKKLGFVHTRDAFDERARGVLDILDRALEIRESVGDRNINTYRRTRKAASSAMPLSEDEIAELLDLYVDSGISVDYAPPEQYFMASMPALVVDGNPDLGLTIEAKRADAGDDSTVGEAGDGGSAVKGFTIHADACVERFVKGHRSSFVMVRPAGGKSLEGSEYPRIYRCSDAFIRNRKLLEVLCGSGEGESLYLGKQDVDAFVRTVLPALQATAAKVDGDPDDPAAHGDPPVHDASAASGIPAALPEELLRLRRLPCVIESFLDRDRDGVTCDLQARYGDDHFHVFNGMDPDSGVLRDKESERLAVEALRHYFPRPDGYVARIPESDDDAIYKLLNEGIAVLRGLGEVFSTPAFDGLSAVSHPVIKLGLSVRSGLVEISPIADEIAPEDVPELLNSYRKRKRYHRLRNGAFVDVRDLDVSALDEVSADLGLSVADVDKGSVQVPAFEAYYLDSQVEDEDKDDSFLAYLQDVKAVDPRTYELPKNFEGVLRPYQTEGFRWLNALCDKGFGGILADEMGLGKTVQLLSFLCGRIEESRKVGPNLIVCPASLVYNWAAECSKFAPDLRVSVVAGSKAERRAMLRNPEAADVLITSYDLLRRDVEDYTGIECFSMVLDEAQYIKNHATLSSRAVRAISARHRYALTGTPIENRLSELWSIFDVLMPGILGSYRHFRERFEMPILSEDEHAQRKLQAFVGPFMLRRLKSQVLKDLPDKIENVVTVRLEGEQRKLYAALEQQLRASLNKQRDIEFAQGKIQILAQLMRLRQVCCDPRLIYANSDATPPKGKAGTSAKLDAIEELVSNCRDVGRKMLIFSQFTSYLDLIAERLRTQGVQYDVITGATPKKRRLDLVEQFNRDQTPVFLISLKAGNTGLNLTGACVVVHADPWWNAAAQDQATDRAHRIGQTQDVNVYQVVAKDTIEERILNLQHSKTDLAARFVDDASTATGSSLSALTKDDLLALLG
ncbi:MAG: SNF2-related protein [Bifidobacterium psychraerophilum]